METTLVNQSATPYDDAVSDFEAGFTRLRQAYGHKDEQRRAWLETLNHTYRIREHRRKYCNVKGIDYKSAAGEIKFGMVTEGIVVVRNIATHMLTTNANPQSKMLYPSEKLFPSEYLFPGGGNMFWLDMHELTPDAATEVRDRDTSKYYEDTVAGFLVLTTLVAVRRFLIEDVGNLFLP